MFGRILKTRNHFWRGYERIGCTGKQVVCSLLLVRHSETWRIPNDTEDKEDALIDQAQSVSVSCTLLEGLTECLDG